MLLLMHINAKIKIEERISVLVSLVILKKQTNILTDRQNIRQVEPLLILSALIFFHSNTFFHLFLFPSFASFPPSRFSSLLPAIHRIHNVMEYPYTLELILAAKWSLFVRKQMWRGGMLSASRTTVHGIRPNLIFCRKMIYFLILKPI